MTHPDRNSLAALIEAVERGEWWGDLPRPAELHTDLCWKAFSGSLDAAKALHEAVLPDEGWEVYRTAKYPGMIPGSSSYKFAAKVGWGTTHRGDADTPARSWLLAILRALAAEGGE